MADERRRNSVSDRDPYEAVLDLVRSVEQQMVRGFDRLEDAMSKAQQGRQDCQDKIHARLNALEQWKSGVLAVTAFVSGLISLVVTWIGGHK